MFRLICAVVIAFVAMTLGNVLHGQSSHNSDLAVPMSLRDLDLHLSEQTQFLSKARDDAFSKDGKQTARWWEIEERLNPLNVYGHSVLEFAMANPSTKEAMICLAYIVEYGEGRPTELYQLACDELVENYCNDPALSYVCSNCTNPISLHEHESFLVRLRDKTSSPEVGSASRFYMAKLFDNCIELRSRVSEAREQFKESGMFVASPEVEERFNDLEKMSTNELDRKRLKQLDEVLAMSTISAPWTAKRTFGRLDYEFHVDDDAHSFQQLAKGLKYNIAHLRVGCIAPSFSGTLADGGAFKLTDRQGLPTLLMFSRTDSGDGEAMYPQLRQVQARFSKDGFAILGVMVDQELADVKTEIKSGQITWPCVWDGPKGPIANVYRVEEYPTVLLLDGERRIVGRGRQMEKKLVEYIDRLIANVTSAKGRSNP